MEREGEREEREIVREKERERGERERERERKCLCLPSIRLGNSFLHQKGLSLLYLKSFIVRKVL